MKDQKNKPQQPSAQGNDAGNRNQLGKDPGKSPNHTHSSDPDIESDESTGAESKKTGNTNSETKKKTSKMQK